MNRAGPSRLQPATLRWPWRASCPGDDPWRYRVLEYAWEHNAQRARRVKGDLAGALEAFQRSQAVPGRRPPPSWDLSTGACGAPRRGLVAAGPGTVRRSPEVAAACRAHRL